MYGNMLADPVTVAHNIVYCILVTTGVVQGSAECWAGALLLRQSLTSVGAGMGQGGVELRPKLQEATPLV